MRKQEHLHTPPFPTIQAWDRDYYCPPEPPAPPIPLPRLTFGTVLMGLSRLFRHLYGIHLRPVKPIAGEVWHSDVHKLEVVDEEKGVIGLVCAVVAWLEAICGIIVGTTLFVELLIVPADDDHDVYAIEET